MITKIVTFCLLALTVTVADAMVLDNAKLISHKVTKSPIVSSASFDLAPSLNNIIHSNIRSDMESIIASAQLANDAITAKVNTSITVSGTASFDITNSAVQANSYYLSMSICILEIPGSCSLSVDQVTTNAAGHINVSRLPSMTLQVATPGTYTPVITAYLSKSLVGDYYSSSSRGTLTVTS